MAKYLLDTNSNTTRTFFVATRGNSFVSIRPCKVRQEQRWRVRWREKGRVFRKFFRTRQEADSHAGKVRSEKMAIAQFWDNLSDLQRERLHTAWKEARRKRLDLLALAVGARSDGSLSDDAPGLGKLIGEVIEAKRNAGRSPRYVRTLENLLRQFAAGREALPVGQLDLGDVEEFLNRHQLASRSTLRARLSAMFRYAVRRGYRPDNPCDRLERIRVKRSPPAIFTPMQTARCLVWLRKRPRALAWFVLTTFAGLRPEEAEATGWEAINFLEGWVTVGWETGKTKQRRVVYPHKTALAWLKLAKKLKSQLPLPKQPRRRAIRALRDLLRFKVWPKDITRHSAASYWLAESGSAARVADSLGHSERTLLRHYKALVTIEQAKRFWGLAPRSATRRRRARVRPRPVSGRASSGRLPADLPARSWPVHRSSSGQG